MKSIQYLILITIVLVSLSIKAQESKEKALYDSLTYHYYQNSQWDSVIDIGKEAIYKGYDFYYLRMRMGLAYDYQSNFRLAERQYTKALEYVPTDANAAYYQYYAALNGGRQDVAYAYFKKYSHNQKELILGEKKSEMDSGIPIKLKPVEQISISSGYSVTGNRNNADEILPVYRDVLMSQTNIRNTQFYSNISFKGNINENFTWNLAYNYNQINGAHMLRIQEENIQIRDNKVQQHEFFGKLSYWMGNGYSIQAFGQYLMFKSELYRTTLESLTYLPPPIGDSILLPDPVFNTTPITLEESDWVAGLKIKRTISLLDIALFGTYSDIYNYQAFQIGGEITIFPNGNYGLYLTNRITYYKDTISDRFIYKVIAGGQLANKLQIMAAATFGDLQYTNEADLGVTYNWSERTSFKADIGISYPLSDNIYLSINYQLTQKKARLDLLQLNDLVQSPFAPLLYEPHYGEVTDTYQFNQHFVFLGLIWYL